MGLIPSSLELKIWYEMYDMTIQYQRCDLYWDLTGLQKHDDDMIFDAWFQYFYSRLHFYFYVLLSLLMYSSIFPTLHRLERAVSLWYSHGAKILELNKLNLV